MGLFCEIFYLLGSIAVKSVFFYSVTVVISTIISVILCKHFILRPRDNGQELINGLFVEVEYTEPVVDQSTIIINTILDLFR